MKNWTTPFGSFVIAQPYGLKCHQHQYDERYSTYHFEKLARTNLWAFANSRLLVRLFLRAHVSHFAQTGRAQEQAELQTNRAMLQICTAAAVVSAVSPQDLSEPLVPDPTVRKCFILFIEMSVQVRGAGLSGQVGGVPAAGGSTIWTRGSM